MAGHTGPDTESSIVSKPLEDLRGPVVSIVVLNYNGLSYMGRRGLKECLDSIVGCDYPHLEAIFVDNGSTDGSAAFVEESYGEKVLVVKNERNLGCAEGFNAGMRVATGDYVATIPNDLVVDDNWLAPIVRLMESDPRVGLTGCKRLVYGTTKLIDGVGYDLYLCGRLNPIGAGEVDSGQYDSYIDGFDFIGIQIIRRKLLEQVGLFDPGFSPFFSEDIDLCFRLRKAGYKIVYVFDSIVWHRGSATFQGLSRREETRPFITYMRERNRIRLDLIHFLTRRLCAVFLIDCLWLLIDPNCTYKRMLLKAYAWNLRHLVVTLRRRREIGPSPPYRCKYGEHLSSLRDPLARLLRRHTVTAPRVVTG